MRLNVMVVAALSYSTTPRSYPADHTIMAPRAERLFHRTQSTRLPYIEHPPSGPHVTR